MNVDDGKELTVKKVTAAQLKAEGYGPVSEVKANDGGWTLGTPTISEITEFGKRWGQQVEIPISRTEPYAMTVTLVFEIYDGGAGLRYYTRIRNDDADGKLRIATSDVLSLNFPNEPHLLHYVPHQVKWTTAQTLARGKRNVVCVYNSGDGWCLNPENNWATSLIPGGFVADDSHTFLGLDVWNDNDDVKVYTDTKAVSLVLFPEEEREYFAVNISVFQGDVIDGRMAAAEQLTARFKYVDPTRRISTNNWAYGGNCDINNPKNYDTYYMETVAPKAAAAGLDAIHIDDFWNGTEEAFIRDSVDFRPQITTNPVAMIKCIEDLGLKFGIWFSPNGGIGSGWGTPDDLADPAVLERKAAQLQETILDKYHAKWDQIDLGIYWKEPAVTTYSHPSDSVFRKVMNTRDYMEYFTNKDPELIMQVTCEVDNPAGAQGNGLIHLPENGVIGTYARTENGGNEVLDMFDAFGLFPMESQLMVWGVGGEYHWWPSSEWYYQFLLPRHTVIYTDPGEWTDEGIALMRTFNNWRKNGRMNSVLNELFRPVYFGPNNDMTGPYVWMYTNEAKSQALLFAIGKNNTVTQEVDAKIRWLDDAKTYLVEDITLLDAGAHQGEFDYRLVTKKTGAELKQEGFNVDLSSNGTRGKAYWIQELKEDLPQQVLYADTPIESYTETWDGSKLTVRVTGTPNTTGTVVVYKQDAQGTEVQTVAIGEDGTGTVVFSGNELTEPLPPYTNAGTETSCKIDNTSGYVTYYAASGTMGAPDWHNSPVGCAYGGYQHYSNVAGSTATVSFEGTQFKFYSIRDYNRGIVSIQIDGGEPVEVDLYAPAEDTEPYMAYDAGELPDGVHTAVITVLGKNHEGIETEGWCYAAIDYFEVSRFPSKKNINVIAPAAGGTLSADKQTATTGETITLTVQADEGYRLQKNGLQVYGTNSAEPVEITDNQDGTYSFVMPAFGVTVKAAFEVDEEVPVDGVALDQHHAELSVGESMNLNAEVSLVDADNQAVIWTSEDEGIVRVDQDGRIEAVSPGETTVTVTTVDGGYSDTCVVTVKTPIHSLPGYIIRVEADHGTVTVTPKRAEAGDTVTIAVVPDAGYAVDQITVFDAMGKEIPVSGNRFTMPACSVTVKVTFKKAVSPFLDITPDQWFYEAVLYAYENGIMDGMGGGKFTPEAGVSRAMVWTVLARMEGVDTNGGAMWYEAAQKWAMDEGVSDGTMPEGNVSREQLAAMLYRYQGSPAVKNNLDVYPDADAISEWAVDAMCWATENGLINGMDGKLNPQGGATRAQLATILMRFVENVK